MTYTFDGEPDWERFREAQILTSVGAESIYQARTTPDDTFLETPYCGEKVLAVIKRKLAEISVPSKPIDTELYDWL